MNANDFINKRTRYYEQQCAADFLDAVYDIDENKVMATLALICTEAKKASLGDTDDKIEFANRAFRFATILINDYAAQKAEHDWEHRND